MPAEPTKSFADFLASVPEAPASAAADRAAAAETPVDEKEAPAEETPKADVSAKPKPESSKSTKTSSQPSPVSIPGGPNLDAIKRALKSGDLETLGELLDEDPAGFDEKTPKWAARNRREAKLKAENAEIVAKVESVVQRYSRADELSARVRGGDFAALPDLVQHLTGQDWDSASIKAFRAVRNADPRVATLSARVAELEPVAQERESERTKAADRAFYETLRDEVPAGDTVRRVPEWEAKVALVLRESLDPDLGEPSLSVKQAAARVVRREKEEYEKRAAIFQDEPRKSNKPRAKTPERAEGASGTATRKLSREEWLLARSAG